MINTLLGKVTNFFEKDFLFASFVPALIFLCSLGIIAAWVVRIDLVWPVIEGWTGLQKAALAGCAGLGIVAFSYVLNGLRPLFLRFWTGTLEVPLLIQFWRLRENDFRRQLDKLRQSVPTESLRLAAFEKFRAQVEANWDGAHPAAPSDLLQNLRVAATALEAGMNEVALAARLAPIVQAYADYSGESLGPIYSVVKTMLWTLDREDRARAGYLLAQIDRRFGSVDSIRATRLGNVVEAYNAYPFKRYGIEAEVFWPHLRVVVARNSTNKAALDAVEEKQTIMSFALTMATLGWLGGLLVLLGGPWLWYQPLVWVTFSLLGATAGFFFYALAVTVAEQFGDLVRASFDLFRLELMDALYLRHPASHDSEKAAWQEMSRLAVYGAGGDFPLRPRT